MASQRVERRIGIFAGANCRRSAHVRAAKQGGKHSHRRASEVIHGIVNAKRIDLHRVNSAAPRALPGHGQVYGTFGATAVPYPVRRIRMNSRPQIRISAYPTKSCGAPV